MTEESVDKIHIIRLFISLPLFVFVYICLTISAVPVDQQWNEGCVLTREVVAVVSGGAASVQLQELGSEAVVGWLLSHNHPSPALLLPLLASASRSVLHLTHRNPLLEAGLTALLSHTGQSNGFMEIDSTSINKNSYYYFCVVVLKVTGYSFGWFCCCGQGSSECEPSGLEADVALHRQSIFLHGR